MCIHVTVSQNSVVHTVDVLGYKMNRLAPFFLLGHAITLQMLSIRNKDNRRPVATAEYISS